MSTRGACGAEGCPCVPLITNTHVYAIRMSGGRPRCQWTVRNGLNSRQAVAGYQCSRAGQSPPVEFPSGSSHHLCAQHAAVFESMFAARPR